MRIDYCPKCGKAGLRYETSEGLDCDNRTERQRYEAWNTGDYFSSYGSKKWCPRCKEWVKPENHPYINNKVAHA